MKLYTSLIIIVSVSSILTTKPDYYWRNYDGDIPHDAVEAAVDKSGKPIYVGQGFFRNTGLLPGTLHSGSTNIRVTAVTRVFSTDKFVKILCSGHRNNFRWVPVKYSDIPLLTNLHLVEGGTESNSTVHIGRVNHEGSTEIGKVYNIAPYQGLALPNIKETETIYQDFEILAYYFNIIDLRSN